MKKITGYLFVAQILLAHSSFAATFVPSNLITGGGSSDVLFQSVGASDASLLSGGIVTLGYFSSNSYVPSSYFGLINTTIADFTIEASALTGSDSVQLGGPGAAGYVDGTSVAGPFIGTSDSRVGRTLYVFVGDAASLAASTAFALKEVGTIQDDTSAPNTYIASPAGGAAPVIGTINTDAFTGNPLPAAGVGTTTFDTLQLEAVPEPSTLLLSMIGFAALLRRKR